jgi:hypothetical protein
MATNITLTTVTILTDSPGGEQYWNDNTATPFYITQLQIVGVSAYYSTVNKGFLSGIVRVLLNNGIELIVTDSYSTIQGYMDTNP